MRLVHSLFTSSDEWDDQMEGFETGWPGFIEVLRVYLANFAGQKAAPVRAIVAFAGDQGGAWKLLAEKLGLSGADVGEVRTAPTGAPRFAGAVEIIQQNAQVREIMLRLDEPGPGIALMGVHPYDGRTHASISMFLFGNHAPSLAAKVEPHWRDWMAKTFATEGS